MSQKIFHVRDGQLSEVHEQPYLNEDALQELLARYPGVIGSASDEGETRRWLLVSREVGVPDQYDGSSRWSLDHLFLDEQGVPTLIEVKRSTDLRIRREVVGQMLDYAANAVAYWPVERIRSAYESRCTQDGLEPDLHLQEIVGPSAGEPDSYWQRVKINLQAGKIRMIFVADQIPRELRRIVEFLNQQMDPAEVLAVEVRQFVSDGVTTLIPTLIGQTAEAAQRKGTTTTEGKQWNEADFFAALAAAKPDDVPFARAVMDWSRQNGARIWWGRGKTAGSLVPVFESNGRSYQLLALWTYGAMEFQLQWLSKRPEFESEAARVDLAARINAIVPGAIPPDALSRRPSVQLARFGTEAEQSALFDVMTWFLQKLLSTQ